MCPLSQAEDEQFRFLFESTTAIQSVIRAWLGKFSATKGFRVGRCFLCLPELQRWAYTLLYLLPEANQRPEDFKSGAWRVLGPTKRDKTGRTRQAVAKRHFVSFRINASCYANWYPWSYDLTELS
jgi:hypothetical protein